MIRIQKFFYRLTHRYREQARSHSDSRVIPNLNFTTNPCGSEPARDSDRPDAHNIKCEIKPAQPPLQPTP